MLCADDGSPTSLLHQKPTLLPRSPFLFPSKYAHLNMSKF